MLAAGLQIPALERGLGLPYHGGLAIDDGSPLHSPHRLQLDPCQTSNPLKKQGVLHRMFQKGKILSELLCNFHTAWRGRHPVRGDCFVCLVFLTLGELNPIPGQQDDQCRLPYQLGQAAGGTTPQPGSSPCLQCLEPLPERHLLSSLFPTHVFLLP